ncbi:MAG: MBL fold metallo-hydrolase [Nitriliruptoraceae bacterium]
MAIRITKYPQSCLLVETGDARLLIDPGMPATAAFTPDVMGSVDAVLYTHRHGDHFDASWLEPMAEQGAHFVANADVATLLDGHDVTVLADRESTTVAGVRLDAYELTHCPMVDGSPGPPNIGYVIDDVLLHPGDGFEAPRDVEVVAAPIAGPSLSIRDGYRMVADTNASHAIPIHYDVFIALPEQLAEACDIATVHVLGPGETVDLDV